MPLTFAWRAPVEQLLEAFDPLNIFFAEAPLKLCIRGLQCSLELGFVNR